MASSSYAFWNFLKIFFLNIFHLLLVKIDRRGPCGYGGEQLYTEA